MRIFTRPRKMLATQKDLKRKIEAMEIKYDEQFRIVFEAITQLIEEDEKPKKKIGYLKRSSVTPWQGVMSSEIAPKPSLQSTANF
jgi:hypothetical protein